jgi:hypothetical protein
MKLSGSGYISSCVRHYSKDARPKYLRIGTKALIFYHPAALVLIEVAGEHGRKPSPPVSFFYMPPVSPFPHITTARSESFDLPDG